MNLADVEGWKGPRTLLSSSVKSHPSLLFPRHLKKSKKIRKVSFEGRGQHWGQALLAWVSIISDN